jgi:hypothetical protein
MSVPFILFASCYSFFEPSFEVSIVQLIMITKPKFEGFSGRYLPCAMVSHSPNL